MKKTALSEVAAILGKRGGQKTLLNKGKIHYKQMAKKRWAGKKLSTGKVIDKQPKAI